MSTLTAETEPVTLEDALAKKNWKAAMEEELRSTAKNKTWAFTLSSHIFNDIPKTVIKQILVRHLSIFSHSHLVNMYSIQFIDHGIMEVIKVALREIGGLY